MAVNGEWARAVSEARKEAAIYLRLLTGKIDNGPRRNTCRDVSDNTAVDTSVTARRFSLGRLQRKRIVD